ncbi:MAG: TIGR02452 family protein [Flavobacterium sp.]
MSNIRNQRVESAKETLAIIEEGFYTINANKVSIASEVKKSVEEAVFYGEYSFEKLESQINDTLSERVFETTIEVVNATSMEIGEQLTKLDAKVACLNFASAKNPGGGFLGGAQAQEECLSRASTLYPTLMKYMKDMYEYNRSQSSYLYSDCMIYSPSVLFFKDDSDELLVQPYTMDIITSPAVNIGAMIQNNKPEEIKKAKEVMLNRLDKIFATLVLHKVDHVVLGAWGCGVFRNDPNDVAHYFAHYLGEGGKYAKAFKHISFAVFDRSKNLENLRAFKTALMK